MIVDSDVQVFPAFAAEPMKALPRDAMPEAANSAQLLGIEVKQIADRRMLIALGDQRRGQPAAPRQSTPPQHARDRRRTDFERGADLAAGPLLAPQHFRGQLQAG